MKKRPILLLLTVLLIVSASRSEADWPMFLKDKEHSSYAEKAPKPPLTLKWRVNVAGPVYSSPIVHKNKVFVGSYDRNLYALDAMTGKVLWTFPTGGELLGTPVVADGTVYFGAKDNKVYAIDAESGKLLWDYETQGAVLTSVLYHDQKVFAGSQDLYFYALDASKNAKADSRRVWRMRLPEPIELYSGIYASPAFGEGSIFIAGKSGGIYAVDPKSGGRNWQRKTASAIYSSPVVRDGVFYVATYERKLYALNAKTGKTVWSKGLEGEAPYAAPVVTSDRIFMALKNGHIRVYDRAKGLLKADIDLCAGIESTPVITGNGTLYAGCVDNGFYALDPATGGVLWRYVTSAPVHASPAITDDAVYIAAEDGSVYAFGQQ